MLEATRRAEGPGLDDPRGMEERRTGSRLDRAMHHFRPPRDWKAGFLQRGFDS